MAIFSKVSAEPKPLKPDVRARPLVIGDADTATPLTLKVDFAYRVGRLAVIIGWSSRAVTLRLHAGDEVLATRRSTVDRPDVRAHLSLPDDARPGFVLVAPVAANEVSLTWQHGPSIKGGSDPFPLEELETDLPSGDVFSPVWAMLASEETPHTPTWRALVRKIAVKAEACEEAKGFLEGMLSRAEGGTIAYGWVVHASACVPWLEDETGETYPLDGSFRRFRQDVFDAVRDEFAGSIGDAGFVVFLPTAKGRAKLSLKVLTERGVYVLGELSHGKILPSDTQAAARAILFLGVPVEDLHQRIPAVDAPMLDRLIGDDRRQWADLPVQSHVLGSGPQAPDVSIIVPLYGRTDFVEHQLLEFSRDTWIREHAEVIYVLDDPKLVEDFRRQAVGLHRLYDVPFTWLWGGANRGFSGANNLGAAHARGGKLLFLNSDAFPDQPGWLQVLTNVLDDRPEIGAAAPRLVFADGSIQHAGMRFRREIELGIWINHHPMMGLDPALDPHREPVAVPAVTGACLAIRRDDFDRVGGWDTGYLIGDFEDSDLCLKLREAGLEIAYVPTVQLTHLERQSFKFLGRDEFRTRVTIYNAVRHQTRWKALLEASVASPSS